LAYLTKAIDRLANPTKGFARVHVRRHPIRNDKILVWLTNKAKIECNGKTDLNPGAPFEKAVLTALARFEDYFPVGTIYIGIDRLRNVTLCTRKGKVRKGKVFSREKDERARGKSEAYDKILDNFEHMPIPYKDFVDVCRGYNLTDSQVLVVVHEAIRDAVLMDKGRPDLPLKYLRKQLSDFEVRLARRARIGGQKADLSQVQEEGPRSRPSAEDVEEAMA